MTSHHHIPPPEVRSAMREAARNAPLGVSLVARGTSLVLVLGAKDDGVLIAAQTTVRRVSSAGLARAVAARYARDCGAFPDLSPVEVLDASIRYQEAANRWSERPKSFRKQRGGSR